MNATFRLIANSIQKPTPTLVVTGDDARKNRDAEFDYKTACVINSRFKDAVRIGVDFDDDPLGQDLSPLRGNVVLSRAPSTTDPSINYSAEQLQFDPNTISLPRDPADLAGGIAKMDRWTTTQIYNEPHGFSYTTDTFSYSRPAEGKEQIEWTHGLSGVDTVLHRLTIDRTAGVIAVFTQGL